MKRDVCWEKDYLMQYSKKINLAYSDLISSMEYHEMSFSSLFVLSYYAFDIVVTLRTVNQFAEVLSHLKDFIYSYRN